MSNKNPNTAQSFAAYIQQNKNSTKNNNISTKLTAERFVEFNNKEKEREAEDRIAFETSQNLFNMRMRGLGWQMERNSEQLWSQFPEGTKEAAEFRASFKPSSGLIEPKNVSYEEAKEIFEKYDYNINHPITLEEYQNLSPKDPRRQFIEGDGARYEYPKALTEYLIFINPEEAGYVRPGNNKDEYNEELNTRIKEYQVEKDKDINLNEIIDAGWDSYLKNLRGTTPELTRTTGASDYSLLADINPTRSKSYIEAENAINKEKSLDEGEDSIINSLNDFYNSHPDIIPHYDINSKVDPIIHTSNVTQQILDSFEKDDAGNIIINGNVFPEYFVYKQIFGEVGNKFGAALQKDSDESSYGLGRLYVNKTFQEEYGMSYDEYMQDVYYKRIKEIRDRLEVLGKKMAKSEKTEDMSNSIQWGFNEMDVMLPRKWKESIADSYAESYTIHPFENAVEELDATLSAIEGGKFSKGFISGFDWMNMASLGFSEVGGSFTKLQVLEKVNEGKSLTEDEKYIYELVQLEDELKGLYKGLNIEKPVWAEIGSGVGQFVADMPMFAVSMGATSGIGERVKYGTKSYLKRFLEQKTFSNAMKLAKRSAIDFSKMYAVNSARGGVVAPFMSITYRSYANKALGQYSFDENGDLKYDPKSKWAMAAGAYLEGANEIASEYWGGTFDDVISLGSKAFGRATGISKWLNKSEVGTWMRRVSQAPMSDATKKTLRNLGYTGILSEPLSEVWGDVMTNTELMFLDNAVNLAKDGKNFKWKKDGRYFDTGYSFKEFSNPDYWITIMGVSTISGGAMTSVAAGRNILTQAKYAKQLVNNKNKALNEIKNEELKNTLRLLGDSENFVNTAIELANFDWDNLSVADKSYAINYIMSSYILQTTMGDIEGQRQMEAFEGTMQNLYNRSYINEGKQTGSIITATDRKGNSYNILEGNLEDPNTILKVRNVEGEILEIPARELKISKDESIDNIMIKEFHNMFSSETEIKRLNTIRQSFESIENPSEQDVRRITSEFDVKPEVGKTVKLVDGTEAVIKEDLKNGKYIIERQNSETAEQEEVEIPVHSILSSNPVTAAAQQKMFEDAREGYENNNPSVAQEVYKSPEEEISEIIYNDFDARLFDDHGRVKLNPEQVISTFGFEDSTTLKTYINRTGYKVPSQIKTALNDALELSKVYNEAITQVSHAVQTKTVKSDVADLTNTLRSAVSTSSPQISVNELLESIINNPDVSTTVKEDFQNILDSVIQNKTHKKATTKTKTKTSVTQKNVKGKRGRKQIEKGIKDLRNALKDNNPIEVLNAITWIDETLNKVEEEPITTEEKQLVEETRKSLKEKGYEIQPMRGMPYHEGMKVTAYFTLNPELPEGTQIIKKVRKPQINKDGVMVQPAEIIVEQGPEAEKMIPQEEDYSNLSENSPEVNINDTIDKARQGDAKSIELLNEYQIPIGEAGVYRFASQEEVDGLLTGKTYQGHFKDGTVDVTSKKEGNTAVSSAYRITFKPEFDLYKDDGRTRLKNEELGDGYITGGYSLNDVATIERKNEDGSYTKVYQSNSNSSQGHSLEGKVTSKKEDSITQETDEPIVIPELEEFFALPDSDKLIETPSEEEQVKDLTDEQREEVKVHNEQSTNIIDEMPVSTLPDDVNTDEVIVDKHENQGNRIYRYDGNQLRNNQKQVKRVPNKEGDAHDLLYKWLDENNIDLQGIVDNELAAIAALNTDIRFMMMTEGTKSGYTTGSPILNTVFQVVEYNDAIKRIHNEKRGGVITFNGKEYLLVGVTGFRTSKEGVFNPEAAHYNFIADKVLKPARNNYVSQTNELNREPYYVHPSMSTKIKTIEAGWLVTQALEDSETKSRSLGELFEDETRNPHGINTKNSKWLIQTRNSTKPITVRVDNEDIVHSLKVSTGYAGGLFLLVPAANGHYIPVSVKIQTTNELVDGTLKDTIWETAQNLLSTEKETRDYAINELCKLLNLTKEGYNIFIDDSEIDFDNPNSAKIVFTHNGTRLSTEIPLSSPDALNNLYKTLFSNIPFQLNVGLQTLVSPGELQAYIDAGVLKTDAALLGTINASYTIHSIGPNLKENPQQDNAIDSQEESYGNSSLQKSQDNVIINYRGHKYYQYTEEQFVDIDAGEIVTNAKEIEEIRNRIWLNKNNPTPARIEPHSGERIYIKSANKVISVSKNGIITTYSPEHSISIINEIERLNREEIRQINAEEALSQVDKLEQEKQEVKQEIQDYKADSFQEVNFNENFNMFNDSEQEVSIIEEESSSQEEEYLIPSEEISGTFTEGVVENSDLNQLSTIEYLSTIEEQLEAEGLTEDTIDSIMDKVYNQLTELGINSYYNKDQESMIKTIIDKIKNCG